MINLKVKQKQLFFYFVAEDVSFPVQEAFVFRCLLNTLEIKNERIMVQKAINVQEWVEL